MLEDDQRPLAEFRADYGYSFRDACVRRFVDEPRLAHFAFRQHMFRPAERLDYKCVMLVPPVRNRTRRQAL
jgi:hypothetical protein